MTNKQITMKSTSFGSTYDEIECKITFPLSDDLKSGKVAENLQGTGALIWDTLIKNGYVTIKEETDYANGQKHIFVYVHVVKLDGSSPITYNNNTVTVSRSASSNFTKNKNSFYVSGVTTIPSQNSNGT